MKLIKCIIRQDRLESVKKALVDAGIGGMTVAHCMGFGRQRGYREVYRGQEIEASFLPKTMVEVAVRDADLERILALIVENARTGKPGDGRIFVVPVEETIRVRTGERGEEAL